MDESRSQSLETDRRERAKAIVDEFLKKAAPGKTNRDHELIQTHPDLATELEDQLRAARLLHSADEHFPNPTTIAASLDSSLATADYRPQPRCPECHSHLNIADATGDSVSCESCGSDVSVRRMDARNFVPGSNLGRFDLLEQVGAGAFGVVWRAFDPHLDREVAIKVPRDSRQSAAEAELFLREGRAASQVRHKNIVAVYEVGRDDDTIYLVSDFIDGQPLSKLLADDVNFSNREVAELVETICHALTAIHDENVVHRDLKPDNVLINKAGIPFVTDFGLAKKSEGEVSMTMDGQVMGTPAYMSPEQARGDARSADARSDIYSLGVMLFEMLTGERPFRGSPHRILEQVTNEDPPSLRTLQPTVPKDLDTICLRCMEKSPSKRFQSAAECAAELRRYLNGEPILSRRIGSFRRAARWCRRKPFVASVVALVLALSVASAIVAVRERQHREQLEVAKFESDKMAQIATNRQRAAEQSREQAERNAELAQANERIALRNAYAAQVSNANSWNPTISRFLLLDEERCPQTLREFTWRHLIYEMDRVDQKLEPIHTDRITSLAFSPDQKMLASCGGDGRIVLWDTVTWKPRTLFNSKGLAASISKWKFAPLGHDVGLSAADNVYRVAFLPDGSGLLSTHHSGEIQLWNPQSGDLVRTIVKTPRKVVRLAISKDAEQIAYVTDGLPGGVGNDISPALTICKLKSPKQQLVLGGLDGFANTIDFSPDGKWLASGGKENTLQIWDTSSGENVKRINYENGPNVVRFSPGGTHLLVASNNQLELLFTATWAKDLGFNSEMTYLSDATFFAGGSRIAAIDGGRRINSLHGFRGSTEAFTELNDDQSPNGIAVSPDGRLVAVSLSDNTIKISSLATHDIFREFRGHDKGVNRIAYSNDGLHLFTVSDDATISKWDLSTGWLEWRTHVGSRVLGLSVANDQQVLAASLSDGRIVVVDLASGNPQQEWQAHSQDSQSLTFLPDGRLLSSGRDGRLAIWRHGALEGEIKDEQHRFTGVDYSTDTNLIAASCLERCVRIYDLSSKELQAEFPHDGEVHAIAFRPGGKQVASAARGHWHLWDISSGKLVQKRSDWESTGIGAVAFSPDGRTIAATEADVNLWDPDTGSRLSSFNEISSRAYSVAFSPDGNLLAYGRENGSVIVRQAIPNSRAYND